MSIRMSLRLPDDLDEQIKQFAEEWELDKSAAILQLVRDGLRTQKGSSLTDRLEAIEERLSAVETIQRQSPVSQQASNRHTGDRQQKKKRQSGDSQQTEDRMSGDRQKADSPKEKPTIPPGAGELFHPRDCAALIGLKYPSGWEGQVTRHGTEFERDGYQFTRTEFKDGRAFLWNVKETSTGE